MSLTSKNKKDFSLALKDNCEHGENIVFVKGGVVALGDQWVNFEDLRIDVAQLILAYAQETSRRIFNNYNDILYVLIALNKSRQIEVLPSITYNKKSFGDVKIFDNLSGKLPLILVKLQQDGSSDLKAFKVIKRCDIEVYGGYGNFTLRGDKGDTGLQGLTGMPSCTGIIGETGFKGVTGYQGVTGLPAYTVQGITGYQGADGVKIPAFLLDRD